MRLEACRALCGRTYWPTNGTNVCLLLNSFREHFDPREDGNASSDCCELASAEASMITALGEERNADEAGCARKASTKETTMFRGSAQPFFGQLHPGSF